MYKKYFPNIGNTDILSKYRKYKIDVTLNNNHFVELWIDPHYEEKHKES